MGADLALVVEVFTDERWQPIGVPSLERPPTSSYLYRLDIEDDHLGLEQPVYSQEGRDSLLFAQLGVRNFDEIPEVEHGSGLPEDVSEGTKAVLASLGDGYGSPVYSSLEQLSRYVRMVEKEPGMLADYSDEREWILGALPAIRTALEEHGGNPNHLRIISWCC